MSWAEWLIAGAVLVVVVVLRHWVLPRFGAPT
jgi:hypothetical protein